MSSAPVERITGVPDDKLKQVVSDYQAMGAKVETELEPDGTWTVIATFSESSFQKYSA